MEKCSPEFVLGLPGTQGEGTFRITEEDLRKILVQYDKGVRVITTRTLLELVEALESSPQPEITDGASGLDADALFRALLRKERLTGCQDKLIRWARDLYGGEADL